MYCSTILILLEAVPVAGGIVRVISVSVPVTCGRPGRNAVTVETKRYDARRLKALPLEILSSFIQVPVLLS